MKNLKLGDMFGHMFAADLSQRETHVATIIASMDGLIACLPFGEIKAELRRAPEAVFKTYQLASKYAMETFMFNLNGVEHNQTVKHPQTAQTTKKLRDFYFKNTSIRAFLNSCDKRDEKFIIQGFKGTEFETGDRIIRKDSWDRSLLLVAEGEVIVFNESGENQVLIEGAIIGVEQFLFNKKWDCDMFCGVQGIVCKLKWESLQDMVKLNASAASKLYKCIMRHYCYQNLYDSGKKV